MTNFQELNKDPETAIRNCVWGFKCDKTWEMLIQTDIDNVRFCNHCQKEVYFCEDDESVVYSVARNRCIAINPEFYVGDFDHGGTQLLGDVRYDSKTK